MAQVSISIGQWAYWLPTPNPLWNPTDGYETARSTRLLSDKDGSSKYRVVIPINIPKITGSQSGKKLKVTYGFSKYEATTVGVIGNLRTAGRSSNAGNPAEQGTLIGSVTCNVNFNSSSVGTFEFDLSTVDNSAKTLYLWLMTNDKSIWAYGNSSNNKATLTYTEYGSVTSPSITEASTVIKPGDHVVARWSGASNGNNNNISKLSLTIRRNSASGTIVYQNSSVQYNADAFSIPWTSLTATPSRGDTLYATIQAIGSVSGYDGAIKSGKICRINTLPSKPTIKQNGTVVNTNSSITFSITPGTDSDNNSFKVGYKINSGNITNFSSAGAASLTINLNTAGLQSGTNTIYFYTYDGLEYSTDYSSATFTVNYQPIITGVTPSYTYVEDAAGGSSTLVSAETLTFTSTGGASSVELSMRYSSSSSPSGNGSVLSTSYYTYNSTKKTITVNIKSLSSSILPYGNYFQLRFRVSDGATWSDYSAWQTVKRRPKTPILPTYSSYVTDAASTAAKKAYFKSKVTINSSYSVTDAAYAKVSSVNIIAYYSNTSKAYNRSGNATSLDLSQVPANSTTTFKFKVTDAMGQTIESSSSFVTLTKTSNLTFAGEKASVSINQLKPITNTSVFYIYHPYGKATGTSTFKYSYKLKIGSVEQSLTSYTTSTSDPNQIVVTVTAKDINTLAKNMISDKTKKYSSSLTVTVTDGFNSQTSLAANFEVNFIETPIFVSNSNFGIKLDYYINNTSTSSGTTITSQTNDVSRMVNKGEGIIFVLPKNNEEINNNIKHYRIYVQRKGFESGASWSSFTHLVDISYSTLKSNSYLYRYKLPEQQKNEYLTFRVHSVDNNGTTSTYMTSPYIIACRTVAPKFTTGNIGVNRNGTTITLKHDFKITDLGGSATSQGWDETFYKNYPNFERTISGYTPKASLKIEIAADANFSTGLKTQTIQSSGALLDFENKEVTFTSFSESYTKIYIRFTLSVTYGLNSSSSHAKVVSSPYIDTYFGSVPTVAHRYHKVGINTASLGNEDVLVIEDFNDSKYVILKGSSGKQIKINLLTGAIDGAIINGGSW